MSSTVCYLIQRGFSARVATVIRNYSVAHSLETDKLNVTKKKPVAFQIFSSPKAVVPPFELTRRIGSVVSETVYNLWFERGFTKEGLIRGANQGASIVARHLADGNWDALNNIACSFLIESLQSKREDMPETFLDQLRFSSDDIVCSFLYSTLISGKNIMKLSESGNLGVYFTVVSFIRLSPELPDKISLTDAVGKYKKDLLVSNITFARTLNPLGSWKATSANFFNIL